MLTTLPLDPGLGAAEARQLAEDLGGLPAELMTLYRSGAPRGSGGALRDDAWYLLEPGELTDEQQRLSGHAGSEGLLPFAINGRGDVLCARRTDDPSAQSEVVEVCRKPWQLCPRFPSVSRWLELTALGRDRGLVKVDDMGGIYPALPFAWLQFLDENNPGFVNDDPEPVSLEPPGLVAALRKAALGIGSFSLVLLVISLKINRGKLPGGTLRGVLGGLALLGVALVAAAWWFGRGAAADEPSS